MNNEARFAKKLTTLLNRLKKSVGAEQPEPLDPINQIVLGFLQWESTTKAAKAAYDRLVSAMVDHNDLRVSHPQEIMTAIGVKYPLAKERAGHLLAALQGVYLREHAVTLERLARRPKKEVRAYLDSLPGMKPYVAAQVTLLCFDGHAVPADEALAELLRKEGVVDPEASVEQIGSFLERRIRASDAVKAHAALRVWVDARGGRRSSGSTGKKTATTKTTTKKKTTKKTTAKTKTRPKTKKTTKKKTTKKKTKKTTKRSRTSKK